MMRCPQIKDEISFGQRLANEAERGRELAYTLPTGKKRDALLEKARLADIGARIMAGWQVPNRRNQGHPITSARDLAFLEGWRRDRR